MSKIMLTKAEAELLRAWRAMAEYAEEWGDEGLTGELCTQTILSDDVADAVEVEEWREADTDEDGRVCGRGSLRRQASLKYTPAQMRGMDTYRWMTAVEPPPKSPVEVDEAFGRAVCELAFEQSRYGQDVVPAECAPFDQSGLEPDSEEELFIAVIRRVGLSRLSGFWGVLVTPDLTAIDEEVDAQSDQFLEDGVFVVEHKLRVHGLKVAEGFGIKTLRTDSNDAEDLARAVDRLHRGHIQCALQRKRNLPLPPRVASNS